MNLVKRLRTMGETGWNPIGNEAADEIISLRQQLEFQNAEVSARFTELNAENYSLLQQLTESQTNELRMPEGWKLVPIEPTLGMLDCLRADTTPNLEKRYKAMLSAAPTPIISP